MDYSMLLGIHSVDASSKDTAKLVHDNLLPDGTLLKTTIRSSLFFSLISISLASNCALKFTSQTIASFQAVGLLQMEARSITGVSLIISSSLVQKSYWNIPSNQSNILELVFFASLVFTIFRSVVLLCLSI
jgi:hypothetical protein